MPLGHIAGHLKRLAQTLFMDQIHRHHDLAEHKLSFRVSDLHRASTLESRMRPCLATDQIPQSS
jgi:hypothetical protein